VSSILPLNIIANQAQVSLMNESGRLQRVPRILMSQAGRSEFAKFIVNQRQQLDRRLGIALLSCNENPGDIVRSTSVARLTDIT